MAEYWKARQAWQADPDAALAEAERRVAACAASADPRLYLGDLDLERLPDGISALSSLRDLQAFGGTIRDLSPLAPLANLEVLQLGSLRVPFPGLDFMAGWTELRALEIITPSAVDLAPAASCAKLTRLGVSCSRDPIALHNLEALRPLRDIEHVALNGTRSGAFDVIGRWEKLRFVQLSRTNFGSFEGFESLRLLTCLHVREAPVADATPIASLDALEELTLSDIPLREISALEHLSSLRRLTLSGTPVRDLAPLGRLGALQRGREAAGMRERTPLRHALREIDLDRTAVEDLGPLSDLRELERITLAQTSVSSIEPLLACERLRSLNVSGTAVTDLGPRGSLAKLQGLAASGTAIRDLSALEPALGLQWLDVSFTEVSDLTSLAQARNCRSLNLRGCRVADLAPIVETGSCEDDHRYSQQLLDFRDTPAAESSERLAELAALAEDDRGRCFAATKAYLQDQRPVG